MLFKQKVIEAVEILCSLLCHNDYYKYFGSQSIILLQQMRIKPLINETTLHKITKPNCFSIKNKVHPLQRAPLSKSLKNIDPTHAITSEIDQCLYALEGCLARQEMPERQMCEKVVKLLTQMRAHSQSEGGTDFREEIAHSMLRSSSSKFHLKGRWQSQEDTRKTEGMVLIERQLFEFKKGRGNKLKIGKENTEKCPVALQIKLQRLGDRLDESQRLVRELREQIKKLNKRIGELEVESEELIFEKQKLQKESSSVNAKLSAQLEKVVHMESELGFKLIESQQEIQRLQYQKKLLGETLTQRECQIKAIWQLQKF